MKKSFFERVRPARQRWKALRWPLPYDGDEAPLVGVRVLSVTETERAYLAAKDYFAAARRKINDLDPAFKQRERAELVCLGFRELDEREQITETPICSVEELCGEGGSTDELAVLHAEWSRFQAETTVRPLTAEEMDEFVDELKKNTGAVRLDVLPSSWLIALTTIMAARLSSSTPASSPG